MKKLLLVALATTFAAGIGFAGTASAAPSATSDQAFTCAVFQDPTVEFVWSHVCHF